MPTHMASSDACAKTFGEIAAAAGAAPLRGKALDTVQVNIGLACNLACRHCHVESSPKRTEAMTWETMQQTLRAAESCGAHTLDITGGAPEMHPQFRDFVDAAVAAGLHVMVRTNLTILIAPGYEDLSEYFADRGVHLVASLPCYLPDTVDRQRGRHVHRDSIEAIRRLNRAGYGIASRLALDLVYNPAGPSLPPNQQRLEAAYRAHLLQEYGIRFNRLYALTNLAIGRFRRDLERARQAGAYHALLRAAFNPATLDGLMCRHQLHVGWDGGLYDCAFNFAAGLPAAGGPHVSDFDPEAFRRRRIATSEHCFGCTAGCGSSCGGVIT